MAGRVVRIVLPLLLIAGCSGNAGTKNDSGNKINTKQITAAGNYLFNGSTLEGWEITDFGTQGNVYVSGSVIVLTYGEGCTGITFKKEFPADNYMVKLEARRVTGNDFFCGMTFPAGDEYCTFIVGGWHGPVVGLSCINGRDASENETTRLMKFENGQWYKICLIVKGNMIRALIDDEIVVDFSKNGKKLSLRPEVDLSKPFGIASWYTTSEIRNMELEMLK
jgi:hypothetical protein